MALCLLFLCNSELILLFFPALEPLYSCARGCIALFLPAAQDFVVRTLYHFAFPVLVHFLWAFRLLLVITRGLWWTPLDTPL